MDMDSLLEILQAISIVAACLVAFGTIKGRNSHAEARLVGMQKDIEYIKEQVSGYTDMRDRLTKVEAACKALHSRVDRIDDQKRRNIEE